jgi:hypothetical protein
MDRAKIAELCALVYDMAEEIKAEASYDDGDDEIMNAADRIMSYCDDIEDYLEDDPADYEATMRDLNNWLDRLQRI